MITEIIDAVSKPLFHSHHPLAIAFGCSLLALVMGILLIVIARYQHVRQRRAERQCLFCKERGYEVQYFRHHLHMCRSRWIFATQTIRACPTPGCPDHVWKEEKSSPEKSFGVFRFIFHKSQFSDNASPEDFIGPLRRILMKEYKILERREPLSTKKPEIISPDIKVKRSFSKVL